MKLETQKRIYGVLDVLNGQSTAIISAHCDLGIPLEDAICAAVRKALSAKASDGNAQLNLIFSSSKERKAS